MALGLDNSLPTPNVSGGSLTTAEMAVAKENSGTLSTVASLPNPANHVGELAYTSDQGLVVSNGTAWIYAGGAKPSYLGLVATNLGGDNASANQLQWMSRSLHTAAVPINQMKLGFQNWALSSPGNEVGAGQTATFTASVEYPIGTRTQVKFNASASGTAASGALLISDWVYLPNTIPQGAQFYVYNYRTYPASVAAPYNPYGLTLNSAAGDGCEYGASVTDKTLTGTVGTTTAGIVVLPTLILGNTTAASYLLIGDSRVAGGGTNPLGEATATSPTVGELAPSFYRNNVAYHVAAVGGDTINSWVGGKYPLTAALSQYVTAVVSNHSINNIIAGNTATYLAGNQQALAASLFPGKKYFVCTIAPNTSSTDNWTTVAGQANTPAQNAQRVVYNNMARAVLPGTAGYFEIAAPVESSRDSGFWQVNGIAQFYTGDGLHETAGGTNAIQLSPSANQ